MTDPVSRRSPLSLQQTYVRQLDGKNTEIANLKRKVALMSNHFSPESTFAIALISAATAATVGYLAASPTAMPNITEFLGTTLPGYIRAYFNSSYAP